MMPAERHLTQDEVDEFLIDVSAPELRAHCAACALCGDRVAALTQSIRSYNHASLAWAEARSNTFTRDLSGHRPTRRVTASAARSVVATIVFGLVASLSASTHLWPAHLANPVLQGMPDTRAFAPDARAQQIASDNAMLEAIDAELTEPDSSSVALVRGTQHTAAQPASAQDRD